MELLRLFLDNGWDINETFQDGCPPFVYAVRDGTLRAFFLANGADPSVSGFRDTNALSEAVRYAPLPVIKLLFEHRGSVHSGQLLHRAVYREKPDVLEVMDFLIGKGADVNKIMYEGTKWYGSEILLGLETPLHDAAEKGRLDVARFLIDRGANPLIEDSIGGTPLQVAEKSKQAAMVAFLYPIIAAASPPEYQYTRGRRVKAWEERYAPSKVETRL